MIPWRVKERIRSWKVRRYLGEAIEALSPLEAATKDFGVEVHMMLGKFHLHRAVAALLTFLHHSGLVGRLGVMFHTDGTIRPRHRRWLEERVRGCEFTYYPSKDERVLEILNSRPHCADYYRRGLSCQPKLVHVPAFARAERVLLLDSDVAFWSKPEAIVDWCRVPNGPPMYQIDHSGDPDPGLPVRRQFDELRVSLPSLKSRPFGIKNYYFNSGIMLFSPHRVSFDIVEDYFKWHSAVTSPETKTAYWFQDWTVEQTAYMLNFATWPDSVPLDKRYGSGKVRGEVSNHFLGVNICKDSSLTAFRQALRDIASGAGAEPGGKETPS